MDAPSLKTLRAAYKNRPVFLVGNGPNIVPVRCSQVHHEDNPTASFWSDDASKRVSKYGTVMFAALQIAAYMGFNPIYLTACDLNYTSHASADPNHARPQIVPGRNFDAARNNRGHVSAHEIALQQCNRLGVDVYNASVGGALEVYPRVDFMEAVMEAQKRDADYGY